MLQGCFCLHKVRWNEDWRFAPRLASLSAMQQAAGDHAGAVLSQSSEAAHEEERKNSAQRPAGSPAAGGRRAVSHPPRSERLTDGVSGELAVWAVPVSATQTGRRCLVPWRRLPAINKRRQLLLSGFTQRA